MNKQDEEKLLEILNKCATTIEAVNTTVMTLANIVEVLNKRVQRLEEEAGYV